MNWYFYDNFMAMNFGSDARYAIFQMQDLLRLGMKPRWILQVQLVAQTGNENARL